MPDSAPAAAPAPALTLAVARLCRGGTPLFEGLRETFEGGLTTCLLGPSGVGKSTLLRLIAGLEPGDGGVSVAAADGAPLAGRIAYMAQSDLLLPWLSALDNVLLGARLRGERRDVGRATALLRQVGGADWLRARPAALSGGMRQRVALARTLMEDRPIVVMDEPFSALDALTRARLQDLAARLLAGRTVVMVTHEPLEALRLGHRVRVLTGRPARLDAPLAPAGPPARPVDAPDVLRLQGELLRRLAGADAPC